MIWAVLDTNVLVSAACLPNSLPASLIRLWLAQHFELISSEPILAEFQDVMLRPKITRRFNITEETIQTFVRVIRELATVVPITEVHDIVPGDKKDNHVIACAILGHAGHIVTGDRHLLTMDQHENIRIITPADFLTLIHPQ
jgi:uncharacterized protein